jgi:ABC-type Zn uptake system ZnuABC Zn-binding protein ZnuA
VIDFVRRERIPVLFAANYFSEGQVDRVASRANISAVRVPEHVDGDENVTTYFELIDLWVTRLAAAFSSSS